MTESMYYYITNESCNDHPCSLLFENLNVIEKKDAKPCQNFEALDLHLKFLLIFALCGSSKVIQLSDYHHQTFQTMALILANDEADYAIKPEATTPALDTSTWPLLLKNYDKRKFFPAFHLPPQSQNQLIDKNHSPCPNRSFHTDPTRLYPSETRSQILHILRRH